MNWVCQNSWKVPFIQSIFFLGSMCGVQIYGWISDKFGRYPSFFCSNLFLAISGITLPICEGFYCIATMRFLMGLNWNTLYTSIIVLCKRQVTVVFSLLWPLPSCFLYLVMWSFESYTGLLFQHWSIYLVTNVLMFL